MDLCDSSTQQGQWNRPELYEKTMVFLQKIRQTLKAYDDAISSLFLKFAVVCGTICIHLAWIPAKWNLKITRTRIYRLEHTIVGFFVFRLGMRLSWCRRFRWSCRLFSALSLNVKNKIIIFLFDYEKPTDRSLEVFFQYTGRIFLSVEWWCFYN